MNLSLFFLHFSSPCLFRRRNFGSGKSLSRGPASFRELRVAVVLHPEGRVHPDDVLGADVGWLGRRVEPDPPRDLDDVGPRQQREDLEKKFREFKIRQHWSLSRM